MTLDQMYDLEETLTQRQRKLYVDNLVEITRELTKGQIRAILETDFVVIHATADQKHKAFLKTKT